MQYVATIEPLHADGTECTHTGRDKRDTGCTGRSGYRASCTGGGCTWSKTGRQAGALAENRSTHLTSHLTVTTRQGA